MIYETLSTIPGSADSHKESIRSRVHVYRFNSNWEQVNDENCIHHDDTMNHLWQTHSNDAQPV